MYWVGMFFIIFEGLIDILEKMPAHFFLLVVKEDWHHCLEKYIFLICRLQNLNLNLNQTNHQKGKHGAK